MTTTRPKLSMTGQDSLAAGSKGFEPQQDTRRKSEILRDGGKTFIDTHTSSLGASQESVAPACEGGEHRSCGQDRHVYHLFRRVATKD